MKSSTNITGWIGRSALLLSAPLILAGTVHAGHDDGNELGNLIGQENMLGISDEVCRESVTIGGTASAEPELIYATLDGDRALKAMLAINGGEIHEYLATVTGGRAPDPDHLEVTVVFFLTDDGARHVVKWKYSYMLSPTAVFFSFWLFP